MMEPSQEHIDLAHEAVKELMDKLVIKDGVPFIVMAATFCTAAASTMATLDRVYGKSAGDSLMKILVEKRLLAESMPMGMPI